MKTTLLFFLLLLNGLSGNTQVITTIAGNGISGYSGDGGPATSATVDRPRGVTVDKKGNVYIADNFNYRIRKVDQDGVITTFAGNGINGYSGDGGPATAAEIGITNITIDTADNIYFSAGAYIRKITPAGIISTIAGNGTFGYNGDGGPATNAAIIADGGIAADRFGNIYFADITTNRIVRMVDAAGAITTFAGNGGPLVGIDGIPATSSSIGQVYAIAADTIGNIYLAASSKVRIVNTSGIINTFAGSTFGYSGDGGPATAAQLSSAVAVAADNFGNIFISDNQNRVVRRVDKDGIIHKFAGNGVAGFSGDGGPATAAQIYTLTYGLAVIGKGALFITDNQVNERIRAVDHPPYFAAGHTYTITACANTPAIAMDTLLSVVDSNTAQPLRWSIATGPMHGTLLATDTLLADAIATKPLGSLYTPTSSTYLGTDSFKVVVNDGIIKDTITVYINFIDCPTAVAAVSGNATQLSIYPNPTTDGAFTCTLTAPATAPAHITITDVTGRVIKELATTTNKPTPILINAAAGVYFVHVRSDMGMYVRRVSITE